MGLSLDEQLKMATESVVVPNEDVTVDESVQQVSVESTPMEKNVVQESVSMPTQPVQNNQMYTQPVAQTQYTQPVQNNQMYVPPVTQGINLNQAAQETEIVYASKKVEFGKPASTRVIENLKKVEPGEQVRMTLLDIPNEVKLVHKVNSVYGDLKVVCWSNPEKGIVGACCKDSEAKPRYFYPVLVYPTMPNNPNQIITENAPELRLLILWDYSSVQSLYACVQSRGGDYRNLDLIANAQDTFGKLQFFPTQDCVRGQYQNVIEHATKFWNDNKDKIDGNFGRLLDDNKYQTVVAQSNVAVPPTQNYSMNDAFNTGGIPGQFNRY